MRTTFNDVRRKTPEHAHPRETGVNADHLFTFGLPTKAIHIFGVHMNVDIDITTCSYAPGGASTGVAKSRVK